MDDDVIEALADAFAGQLNQLMSWDPQRLIIYDCIVEIAVVIHDFQPTYDLRYFYKRTEYPEPYPTHEM